MHGVSRSARTVTTGGADDCVNATVKLVLPVLPC